MEDKPNYYAIVPANVRYDKDLVPNAKLIYAEISALCNAKGYCYASNGYFAEIYNVAEETVSRWITQLKDKGYIDIKFVDGKRIIYISEKDTEKKESYLSDDF